MPTSKGGHVWTNKDHQYIEHMSEMIQNILMTKYGYSFDQTGYTITPNVCPYFASRHSLLKRCNKFEPPKNGGLVIFHEEFEPREGTYIPI